MLCEYSCKYLNEYSIKYSFKIYMNICDDIEIFVSPKRIFNKIFLFWKIFFWIFNGNLNIMNIYQHELNIYLNIYESIMRALNIQINIQKYAWIFKIWRFIRIFNFLNIHFVKKNSKTSWIFMIFMNIHDIHVGMIRVSAAWVASDSLVEKDEFSVGG